MSDRKTVPTGDDVETFLARVEHQQRREDAEDVTALMREVTSSEPQMCGTMIGFGRQPYTTADGKVREWFAVGLAPRKAALTLYGLTFYGSNEDELAAIGPHTTGKGCVYIKNLADIDRDALRSLIAKAWADNHVAE